ncbi:MAG: FGGY family carbohydrate kinase [Arachnia sp.]
MSVLGIDLGTSGIRVAAYALDGRELAAESRDLVLSRPAPGRVEHSIADIRSAVETAVSTVAAREGLRGDPVAALSFSVLGEAVLPVDDDGAPLGPVVVSMDDRGTGPAARIAAEVSSARFHAITGQPLHPMFSAFKIAAEHAWRDAARYLTVGEYFTLLWTGEAAVDYGMAARTGLFDVDRRAWSDDLLGAFGRFAPWLTPDRLSRPGPSGSAVGTVRPAVAERLGLPAGVVVALGTHDQAAAYLGVGGRAGVRSCISLGSSDCFTVGSLARPQGFDDTGLASYPIDDETWITLAGTAAGGWALEWVTRLVGRERVGDVFDDLSPTPPPLIVLPYLRGSGTLDNDPAATGTVHGLTLETSLPELARSFVEASGLEFAKIAAAFEARGVDPGALVVAGGGGRNAAALQARANALGRPLAVAADNASCRGAALLAARAIGLGDAFAATLDSASAPLAPEQEHLAWYASQRQTYVALRDATAHLTPNPSTQTHHEEKK